MSKYQKFDDAKYASLVSERDNLETKRKEEASRIHDMMAADKAGWDEKDHLMFREHSGKCDHYKGLIADIDAEIKSLDAIRPLEPKLQKRKYEGDPLVRWMRNGRDGLTSDEIRQQKDFNQEGSFGGSRGRFIDPIFAAVVVPGDNTSVLDETVVQSVIDGLHDFGGAMDCFTIAMTSDGNAIKYPVYDDGTTEAQKPTGTKAAQQKSLQTDGSLSAFTQRELNAFVRNTGFIDISRYMEEDVQWDVGAFVRRTLMRRMGRLIEKEITLGSLTATNGATIATPLDARTVPIGMAEVATDYTTTTNGTTFDWTEFNNLIHSVDRAYLKGEMGLYGYSHKPGKVGFMMNWETVGKLKNMTVSNADNRPLLIPSIQTGAADMLLGYPIFINQELPDGDLSAANNRPIYFGNWSYFVVRFAGAGLAIEQHYDSETALDNTFKYLGRIRYDSNVISATTGTGATVKTPVFKALKRKA